MTAIYAPDLVGIDKQISRCQKYLDKYLSNIWDGNIAIDGPLYVNDAPTGTAPEAYVENNDYKEVLIDDTKDCTIAFVLKSPRTINQRIHTATVELIATGNIKNLLSTTLIEDERIYLNLYEGILNSQITRKINSSKHGIANVFSGFGISNDYIQSIQYRDMFPWFCLSFELEIDYVNTIC